MRSLIHGTLLAFACYALAAVTSAQELPLVWSVDVPAAVSRIVVRDDRVTVALLVDQRLVAVDRDGDVLWMTDTLYRAVAVLVAATAGETWQFQAWYRDANPQPTSNLSNSISVQFE